MARIAGVNLPLNKRSEIGLTYIFGIGRSTANKLLAEVGVSPDTYVRDLTEDEVSRLRDAIDAETHRRGRPAAGALAGHQTAAGDRVLPRPAPPSRPAGAGPEDEDQRAHPQGPQAHAGRRQEESWEEVVPLAQGSPSVACADSTSGAGRYGGSEARARETQAQEEHPCGAGAHQDVVQQHDRLAHRRAGQRDRLGVRGRGGLQGLAQVHPLRGPGHRGRRGPQGPRAGAAEGRGLREGPRLRPRDRDPLALRRGPRSDRREGRDPPGAQWLSPPQAQRRV